MSALRAIGVAILLVGALLIAGSFFIPGPNGTTVGTAPVFTAPIIGIPMIIAGAIIIVGTREKSIDVLEMN